VFEAAAWVKSMYMTNHYCKPDKKRKYGNQGYFLHKSPSNIWVSNGIHSLINRADARGSADIIYRM